ncbi:uncharacterized protein LOC109019559 [Juglans regia]|uniref:Uncharacterized protein LOC109019559 n=1 Tax=Juglans regia TaxID=51240 RepID=A0A6P9EW55_JUGRE|nr:uncharacterized protein LOC109019559 [Juglans regia]
MEMEVVDFNFDSSYSSPYMTTPSSPQQFGNFYFSAPTNKLFDGKKIKPLKPPPQLQVVIGANDHSVFVSSPRSTKSRISQGKRMVQEALSLRCKKDLDPFTTTIEETPKNEIGEEEKGRDATGEWMKEGDVSLSPTPKHSV